MHTVSRNELFQEHERFESQQVAPTKHEPNAVTHVEHAPSLQVAELLVLHERHAAPPEPQEYLSCRACSTHCSPLESQHPEAQERDVHTQRPPTSSSPGEQPHTPSVQA